MPKRIFLAAAVFALLTGCASLAERLASPDPEVRAETAEQINEGRIGKLELEPEDVRALASALGSADPQVQRAAIALVAVTRETSLLPNVVALFAADGEGVASAAVAAASEFEPADQVATLLPALEAAEAAARIESVKLLAALGDRATLPQLLGKLADEDAGVRRETLEALERFDAAVLGPVFLEGRSEIEGILEDVEPSLRRQAVELVHRTGERAFVAALMLRLGDDDERVRDAAAAAVAALGEEEMLSGAVEASSDPAPSVRLGAVQLLGKLPKPEAAAALAARVADDDPLVLRTAVEALVSFDPALLADQVATLAQNLAVAVQGGEPELSALLVELAKRTADATVLTELAPLFAAEDESLRQAALDAVVSGGSDAVGMLLAKLNHKEAKIRAGVVAALGRIGEKKALQPLAARLTRDPTMTKELLVALNALEPNWAAVTKVPGWVRGLVKMCGRQKDLARRSQQNEYAKTMLEYLEISTGRKKGNADELKARADALPPEVKQDGERLLIERKQTITRIGNIIHSLGIRAWRDVAAAVVSASGTFAEGESLQTRTELFMAFAPGTKAAATAQRAPPVPALPPAPPADRN